MPMFCNFHNKEENDSDDYEGDKVVPNFLDVPVLLDKCTFWVFFFKLCE